MKNLVITLIIALLSTIFITHEAHSQRGPVPPVNYEMSVNERGYALFHRQNISNGVSAADFGEWVASNAEIRFVPHIKPELLETGENV